MSEIATNPYLPHLMRVGDAHEETPDVRTLRLDFVDSTVASRLQWEAGQFGQFSIFNFGTRRNSLTLSVTRTAFSVMAWAAMSKSMAPMGAPFFFR